MLDVVFIMLIFFIVTTSFVKETGIDINRPSAATAEEQAKANILIAITPDGEIWLDKRPIDIRAVRANIQRLKAKFPRARSSSSRCPIQNRHSGAGHGPDPLGRGPQYFHCRFRGKQPMKRIIFSVLPAVLIVCGLFWVLQSMIEVGAVPPASGKSLHMVDFIRLKKESPWSKRSASNRKSRPPQ